MATIPLTGSGPRVVSNKQRHVNRVKKLQTREINSSKGFNFTEERFRNIQLQEEYHTYDPDEAFPLPLPFRNSMSSIIQILAIGDVLFALAQSGVCTAFSRETMKRICFLNLIPGEVIQSLFYNKKTNSLITISVCTPDRFYSLICRTTSIEYIQRGESYVSFRLFELESMKWPSFVKFDDVNGKVIMYCAEDKMYKVFDLNSYTLLYSIFDETIQEIKISPGILLLVYKSTSWGIPLKIVSVEDGTVLKSFTHQLNKNNKVVLIQLFNEKLLVKQENENLQIVDVRDSGVTEVSRTESLNPSAYIFLYENQLFLTFTDQTVTLWNLRRKLVTSFEDHVLWHPYYNTDTVCVTRNGDLIIAYCKADTDNSSSNGNAGSININNILNGKCVQKITRSNSSKSIQASNIRSTVAEALEDITFLSYDKERNEIFTGNSLGQVHVWTN